LQVTAALVEEARDPFRLETLELADPGADELQPINCVVCHGK
jgi:Zn-dependent alcohol dehydrogenase